MSILICITDKPAQFFFPQFGHANAQKKERKRHRKLTVPDMLMHRIASAHVHFTRGLISFSFLVVSFQQNQTHRSIWPTLCNGFSLCHFHFVFIDCFFFPRFVINNNDNALLVNIVGIFASCLLHHPFGEQVCPARVVPYQKKYNIDGCKIGNFSIFENHDQWFTQQQRNRSSYLWCELLHIFQMWTATHCSLSSAEIYILGDFSVMDHGRSTLGKQIGRCMPGN